MSNTLKMSIQIFSDLATMDTRRGTWQPWIQGGGLGNHGYKAGGLGNHGYKAGEEREIISFSCGVGCCTTI
jgi:hypothetical protein